MRLALTICVALLLVFQVPPSTGLAQESCSYQLGFKLISDQIPDMVGSCLENEHFNTSNGNAEQRTTAHHGKGGLLVWRKADNWTAFTDGYWTWVNGPKGLQKRLNTARFEWEKDPVAPGPQGSPQPAPAPAPPPGFGSGTMILGKDIGPGTYRSNSGTSCYWERLSGFGGTLDEIIVNGLVRGPVVVTIAPTDKGFRSSRCDQWVPVTGPITSSLTAPFGDGQYIVGVDIAPGTWRREGSGSCYWERLSGFGGTLDEIVANDNIAGPAVVTVAPSDKGFSSSRCGKWTKVG